MRGDNHALVSDRMVEMAFDWLRENAAPAAAAKAERIKAEHNVKRVKARLFLEAQGSSIAERDAWALCHDDYGAACDREAKAVEQDEWHRLQRGKAEALIDAWRTEQSNMRAMSKVG